MNISIDKIKGLGHIYEYHVICYDKNGRRVFSDWSNHPFHIDKKYFEWAKKRKPNIESCVVLQVVARIPHIIIEQ